MKNIIILASGSGSNAENIMQYFNRGNFARVTWLISDNHEAYALKRAEAQGVNSKVFSRVNFKEGTKVLDFLVSQQPDLIVLAGFLLLVPSNMIQAFQGKIINIHPSLLPKHGGKGMYGIKVHESVISNRDKESGITIHHVNEKFDEGQAIFQATCPVSEHDTADTLAKKIQALEHEHFPRIIESLLVG